MNVHDAKIAKMNSASTKCTNWCRHFPKQGINSDYFLDKRDI